MLHITSQSIACDFVALQELLNVLLQLYSSRVAKFKRPCALGNQKVSEDNQKLRPGCPPDYQTFCERIDPKVSIQANLSSYFSLTNKNSSMRTSTTCIYNKVPK